jgi:hypothetical protein
VAAAGDSTSLPADVRSGRLHVDGHALTVEVVARSGETLTLTASGDLDEVHDGDGRLTYHGDAGAGLLAGAVQVLDGGRLRFVPGSLHAEVVDPGPDDDDEPIDESQITDAETVVEAGQRRDAYRVPLAIEVTVTTELRTIGVRTIDVSNTGCLLQAEGLMVHDGLEVLVTFLIDGLPLALEGHVVRVDQPGRVGVQFDPLDQADDRRLSQFLAARQRQMLRRR